MTPTLLRRAIERFGCDFINSFGAGTEAGLQAMLDQADHRAAIAGKEHLLGSIGKPATGVDLRIVDDDGTDVPTGVELGRASGRERVCQSESLTGAAVEVKKKR